MIYRQTLATVVAIPVTFALLWVMQLMISIGRDALVEPPPIGPMAEIVRLKPAPPQPPPPARPEPPSPPELRPAVPQTPQNFSGTTIPVNFGTADPAIAPMPVTPLATAADGDSLSLFRAQPAYPLRAAERGIEGWCEVEFAVTARGTVADARILACSHQVFESSSLQAVAQWRYRPRVVNGQPVEHRGVRTRFVFELER